MKLLHHGLWLILAVILQATLMSGIAVLGVSPNLLLVIVVLIGFMCGRIQGLFTGMVYGLVFDIMVGRFIGAGMIGFMLAGYISAVVSDRFYSIPSFYVFVLLAAALTAAKGLVYAVPCLVVYNGGVWSIIKTTLIECIYNGVLIVPAAALMKRTLPLCRVRKF